MDVVFARGFVHELADQDHGPDVADVRVEVNALLQVGREQLEVGFPLVLGGGDGDGQGLQADRAGVEQDRLGARRVVQDGAFLGGAGLRDGLLVEHIGAFLAANGRQAALRHGEGLTHAHGGRTGGPDGEIGHGEGSA